MHLKRKISYKAQKVNIVKPKNQLNFLNTAPSEISDFIPFKRNLEKFNKFPLRVNELQNLQINLGYMCNQVCEHCHVDAGPDRKEIMTQETMISCLNAIKASKVKTVDLTGGAPEMNPHFKWFVKQLKAIGVEEIIIRSNLTIVLANKKYFDLPKFFKQHQLRIISSLPCYTKQNTDNQRGNGVFEQSIKVLKMLNELGYGKVNSGLVLDLVYNPGGAFLPGDQGSLEKDYKRELQKSHGLFFNQLFTITNMPISRFLDFLINSEKFTDYMTTLCNAFNPSVINGLMCKDTLSVSWDGYLYDCDFNQMLELKVQNKIDHISNFDPEILNKRKIAIADHCYGCTAGSGSSCNGTVV